MAQPPHKPEHKPEPKKPDVKEEEKEEVKEEKKEMEVAMPGSAPLPAVRDEPTGEVHDATKAEQEAGRKAKEVYDQRLKSEQEAGEAMVAKNAKIDGSRNSRG